MTATITPIGGNGGTPPPAPKPIRKKPRKQRLSNARQSNGSPYDDLTLVLERAKCVAEHLLEELACHEAVVLASILHAEIEDALRVARPAPDDWYAQ